jgi:hypothetical protein
VPLGPMDGSGREQLPYDHVDAVQGGGELVQALANEGTDVLPQRTERAPRGALGVEQRGPTRIADDLLDIAAERGELHAGVALHERPERPARRQANLVAGPRQRHGERQERLDVAAGADGRDADPHQPSRRGMRPS